VPLYEESLSIFKKVLGEDHPNVATLLNNLARLLKKQVNILTSFRSITAPRYGGLLSFQGKYDEAEPLYKQSLEIKKKVYGEDHPSIATGLNNLAGLLQKQVPILNSFRSITAPRYGAIFRF